MQEERNLVIKPWAIKPSSFSTLGQLKYLLRLVIIVEGGGAVPADSQ